LKNANKHIYSAVIQKINQEFFIMSRHPSLKSSGKIRSKRNVLKRYERIDILSKDGRWKEGTKVLGLPKTKHVE